MSSMIAGRIEGRVGAGVPTRSVRIWRGFFAGIWLVYLVAPAASLFGHHHSGLYIAGGLTIVAAFCVVYVAVISSWECSPARARLGFAALFVLAAVASVAYHGNGAWLFVSAAAGLTIRAPRTALRVIGGIAVCYTVTSLLGHDGISDFLITLIPTVLVGLAMVGFRRQIELTRELTRARETVAQLAASEERLRLARDMHDLTGQSLSMITLKSELAARLLRRLPDSPDRDRVGEEIEQVAAVSRQTLQDIREAVSGYRRPTLAVEIITARTALESARIQLEDDPALTMLSGTFDPDAEAALAWCLREAVTNVIRHSGAKNCHISLTRQPDVLSLEVRDDGVGLRSADYDSQPSMAGSGAQTPGAGAGTGTGAGAGTGAAAGAGLHGMSERLGSVGGRLELRPSSRGFCLVATVPVRDSASVTT
jgi:two-component system, NarL family, sensor histidine kinase DesK